MRASLAAQAQQALFARIAARKITTFGAALRQRACPGAPTIVWQPCWAGKQAIWYRSKLTVWLHH